MKTLLAKSLLITALALISFTASLAAAVPAPEISISPQDFYPFEEILYLEGRAEPNALVTVILEKPDAAAIELTRSADTDGSWFISQKVYLAAGNWEFKARQKAGEDISDWSPPKNISVVLTGANIAGFNVHYVVIGVLALIIFAVLVMVLIYLRLKVRGIREQTPVE